MNAISNYVQLIGCLRHEVNYKELENGNNLARFSLATKEVHRDKSGERHVEVQAHNIIGWGKVAYMMNVLLKKGSSVLVQGKLQYRMVGQAPHQQVQTEVVVKEFRLIH